MNNNNFTSSGCWLESGCLKSKCKLCLDYIDSARERRSKEYQKRYNDYCDKINNLNLFSRIFHYLFKHNEDIIVRIGFELDTVYGEEFYHSIWCLYAACKLTDKVFVSVEDLNNLNSVLEKIQ